jgi:DNA-binding transcriptional ArsR family regulator
LTFALKITKQLYNTEVIDMSAAALKLDETFAALADPTRRAILRRLAQGQASVSELAAPFDMSQPAISKHLKVLERAGLISTGQDAQRRPRRLEPEALVIANDFLIELRTLFEARYAALDAVLAELKTGE